MTDTPPKTVFGLPVQIIDGLPTDTVIIGGVTIILQGGRPVDAKIDGVVMKLGGAHAQG